MTDRSKTALWGIDLGGTKIEGVVLHSATDPQVLCRQRVDTQGSLGYQHVLQQIDSLITGMSDQVGFAPHLLGIGTPGSLNPRSNLIKGSNSQHLNDRPLHRDLSAKLGIPVEIANDANCFALAETRMGIVAKNYPDAKVVFGVIMGTGVGGGLVVNGHVLNGKHGIAGEWGHNFLHQSGGVCYCGRTGCVETVISGPALERYYVSLGGQSLALAEINRLCDQDEKAAATIQRLHDNFALAISTVINTLDPDVIVIGGGVGNIESLYSDGLQRLPQFVFHPYVDTPVVSPALGDSAGVFGAALLTMALD